MGYPRKIATCCYCGTRAALTLGGRERHELACSNCGAPLHELKMLKATTSGERELAKRMPTRARPEKKPRKPKKRSLRNRLFEELWDVAEDVFDEIFD